MGRSGRGPDVTPYLWMADACGCKCYRRFGPFVSWMDRDDWIQEARVALLRVAAIEGPGLGAMSEGMLAYAIRNETYRSAVSPRFAQKREARQASEVELGPSVLRSRGRADLAVHLFEVAHDVQRL